jgi:transcriptional regulator GlxA family with amidase domain
MNRSRPELSLRDYGPSRGSHSHEHFQVLVGLRGTLELEVEGCGQRVGAGDGFVVAPGDRHDFEAARGSSCLVLDTGDELWARCATTPRQPAQVHALAAFLAQALRAGQPLAALHGPALLLEAWSPAAQRHVRPRRAIDWAALAAWVQARLDAPIAIADLAARVCLSTSQFALRCHEAQRMSPQEWLRGQRLDRARQMRDAGWSVAEVARRTGYRSPSALTAALRKRAR